MFTNFFTIQHLRITSWLSMANSVACLNTQKHGQFAQKPGHDQLKNCWFFIFFLSSKFNHDNIKLNVKKKIHLHYFLNHFLGKLDFNEISLSRNLGRLDRKLGILIWPLKQSGQKPGYTAQVSGKMVRFWTLLWMSSKNPDDTFGME